MAGLVLHVGELESTVLAGGASSFSQSLEQRIEHLEEKIHGNRGEGALLTRVRRLEEAVFGAARGAAATTPGPAKPAAAGGDAPAGQDAGGEDDDGQLGNVECGSSDAGPSPVGGHAPFQPPEGTPPCRALTPPLRESAQRSSAQRQAPIVREVAEAPPQLVLYLPEFVNGKRVFREATQEQCRQEEAFIIDTRALGGRVGGLAYRNCRQEEDRARMNGRPVVEWDGSIVRGALINGWLEVTLSPQVARQIHAERYMGQMHSQGHCNNNTFPPTLPLSLAAVGHITLPERPGQCTQARSRDRGEGGDGQEVQAGERADRREASRARDFSEVGFQAAFSGRSPPLEELDSVHRERRSKKRRSCSLQPASALPDSR